MDKTQGLQLKDIHLPADPSIWPLAPGWWVLIFILLIVVYFAFKKLSKIRNKRHTIVHMQEQLQQLRDEYEKHKNKHKLAIEISELLNRFVRHILNDSNATALTGKAWIKYLNEIAGEDVFTEFSQELTQAQYNNNIDYDVSKLIATVKSFFAKALNEKSKKAKNNMTRSVKNA
jgi:galactokinase